MPQQWGSEACFSVCLVGQPKHCMPRLHVGGGCRHSLKSFVENLKVAQPTTQVPQPEVLRRPSLLVGSLSQQHALFCIVLLNHKTSRSTEHCWPLPKPISYRAIQPTTTLKAQLMASDTPFGEGIWEDMAYERFDAHGHGVELILDPFMNESDSLVSEPYLALSYNWGKPDSLENHHDAHTYQPVGESVDSQRGNNWVNYDFEGHWNPLEWLGSQRNAAVLASTQEMERPDVMQIWKNGLGDDGRKRWQETSALHLPPTLRVPLVDSRQESSTTVACPVCRCVFTGAYRMGNFNRHVRTKQNTHCHGAKNRHRKLAYAIFLTGAQLACTIPLHSYDHCHGDLTCRPPIASSSILNGLPLYLDFLGHPTTNVFVLSALAYSATAMHQYHVDDRDRFQQLCLVLGVVMGFFLGVASPVELTVRRMTSSAMAIAITTALLVSALGHWVYPMVRSETACKDVVAVEEKKTVGDSEV
ncbi:hypothetical protein DE146DRAFT_628512 [Phaeosphaeria sp. MPI-PUGE-AT-0046c]|nr:hypothetical protein DE146DRAFT_628512 [Phaeosphaeria sp. MPI-PUGE-AT-0046c]